jgi:hypothetical protein
MVVVTRPVRGGDVSGTRRRRRRRRRRWWWWW